jgi:methyl-accepting chemotaxis protein
MTIMNPPDDAPGLGRRLARAPLFYKILGANAAIVVAGALIGTTISLQQGALHPGSPHYHLIALFAAPGILVSVTANLLLLRTVLKPLESLQDAFDAVRAGRQGVRVARSALSDERFDRLAGTFDHMIATLEQHAARLQHLPGQIL